MGFSLSCQERIQFPVTGPYFCLDSQHNLRVWLRGVTLNSGLTHFLQVCLFFVNKDVLF